MSQRDTLISWLNDAYGLEQNLIKVLESHVQDAEPYPTIQSRLRAHLEETRRHAEMVEQCIQQLGGKPSAAKSAMGKMSGFFSGTSTAMADDEMVKNMLSDYSMEHFEIASYQSLIAAAESQGEMQVAETCREILHDEEDMAQWLEETLPSVTNEYLAHQPA